MNCLKIATKRRSSLLLCSVGIALLPASVWGAVTPIDLGTWSVVQYELFSQPNANWVLSSGNTVANQTVNADASILLSDFSITGTEINGTWRVNTSSDDDFMGFVFGYQNRGQYYLFDWKQSDQNDALGFAERGMSVKVVDTSGSDPTGNDLWPSAGSANVSVLQHNTVPWKDFTDYEFNLNFGTSGVFEITVKEGVSTLAHWLINDSTYMDGGFGFYNYSQGNVGYAGFTLEDDPRPPSTVPEGSSMLAIGVLAPLALRSHLIRRRRCS